MELSPEVLTSLRVWRTLHTEGMYPYHIKRIQHLEPSDMCSRLELCRWIHSNPQKVRFVTFIHRRGPHKVNMREELPQRILSAAVLRKFTSSLVTRVRKCIQADGGHFEQPV
jgi:phosphosulfolactate synthase (CoM biosynthesis protein A)